jgi:hypothetical protein
MRDNVLTGDAAVTQPTPGYAPFVDLQETPDNLVAQITNGHTKHGKHIGPIVFYVQ